MENFVVYLPLVLLVLWGMIPFVQKILDKKMESRLQQAWDNHRHLGRKRDLDASLEEVLQLEKELRDYDSFVDDQTWHDLDMQKIFRQIDDAYSSLGSEALYRMMRLQKFGDNVEFSCLIEELQGKPALISQMQLIFYKLGKKNYNQARVLVTQPVEGQSFLYLVAFLGCLPLIGILLLPLHPLFGFWTLLTGALNIVISLKIQLSLNARLEQFNYLVRAMAAGWDLAKLPFYWQKKLQKKTRPFSVAKILGGFFIRQNSANEMDILGMYINMFFLLPAIAQSYITRQLQHYQQEAAQVLDMMGRLETAISVMHYREKLEVCCQPNFHERPSVVGKALYHPLVDHPVANDVHFLGNMMISGDNASGKSTYLRTVAVNILLAQSLSFACGESLYLKQGHVLTAMDVSDDIETGDSYFITESKAIQRMIESLSQPGFHYLFIDELFKGTNTVERIGSGLGIVRWLADHSCLYMISSHDVELVSASKVMNQNYHFDSQYVEGRIVFDYLIKSGASVTKNAVNTLESLQFPETITQTARKVIEQYEETGRWSLEEL